MILNKTAIIQITNNLTSKGCQAESHLLWTQNDVWAIKSLIPLLSFLICMMNERIYMYYFQTGGKKQKSLRDLT